MNGNTGENHGMIKELSEQDVYKIAADVIQRRGFDFDKDLFEQSALKLQPKSVPDFFANLFLIIKIYEARYNLRELEEKINYLKCKG